MKSLSCKRRRRAGNTALLTLMLKAGSKQATKNRITEHLERRSHNKQRARHARKTAAVRGAPRMASSDGFSSLMSNTSVVVLVTLKCVSARLFARLALLVLVVLARHGVSCFAAKLFVSEKSFTRGCLCEPRFEFHH